LINNFQIISAANSNSSFR